METKQLLEAVETIRIVKSLVENQQNQWLPVIAAIGGAFVGSISSFFPNYLLELKRHKNESRTVASALIAEIGALLTIIKHRKYVEGIRDAAVFLRANPGTPMKFCVRVPAHYSRVYQAHVHRLGLIQPDLSTKIIEFHQLIDAIVRDITPGGPLADEGGDAEAFEQLANIINEAVSIGRKITELQS